MADDSWFPPGQDPVTTKLNTLLKGQQTILNVLGQLASKSGHDAAKIASMHADIQSHSKELQAAIDAAQPKEN